MNMKIKTSVGLDDSKRNTLPNIELPNDFIPRIGDTLVINDLYWDVRSVVIDYAYKEIRVWIKDSVHFS